MRVNVSVDDLLVRRSLPIEMVVDGSMLGPSMAAQWEVLSLLAAWDIFLFSRCQSGLKFVVNDTKDKSRRSHVIAAHSIKQRPQEQRA